MSSPVEQGVAAAVEAAADGAGLQSVRHAAQALRQPLSLIVGPTQHLLEDTDESDPRHAHLAVIARNCEILLARVDELYATVRAASRARVGFRQTGQLLARNLAELVQTPHHVSALPTVQEPDRFRVLVVDDSPDTRLFVAAVLGPFVEVTLAGSGEEALATLRAGEFDTVVSDVMMPGMGGDELARALRTDPRLRDVGIMLLTGRSDPEFRAAVIHETVDDYLVKPFDTNELTARVVRLARDARTRSQLRRQARTDALTGLPNRAAVVEELEHIVGNGDGALSVAILDIDHFKQVNDTHGHTVGDEALRHFAARLTRESAPEHLVGRWGGEEFVVLYPGLALAAAKEAVAGLVAAVAAEPHATSAGPLTITASAGVAERDAVGESWPSLLARSDTHLYEAKNAGRNRVCA